MRSRTCGFLAGLGLSLALSTGTLAQDANDALDTGAIETGSIKPDAHVAPVRRVFPKTPTDRELNRLLRTQTAKAKRTKKTKKR